MNIHKIVFFLFAFALSFAAHAIEKPEMTDAAYYQMPLPTDAALGDENRQKPLQIADAAVNQTVAQASSEPRDVDLFTKLCIYLSIVMIYWLYWLKNSTT